MTPKIYIQFYNIKDSTNRVEYGPFKSIVCDGTNVIGVAVDESEEETVAAWDQDREDYMVYRKSYPPFFYGYFEVITR